MAVFEVELKDGSIPAQEPEKKIFKAICGVMADVGAIGKDQVNKDQKYKFRGIDQVYNALQPAMIKNHVFAVPIVEKEERTEHQNAKGTIIFRSRLHITYRFYADDGSYIEAFVIGEAMDSGDKCTNKAMSAAYKYACFQVFCIPTEDMVDADAETYDNIQRQPQAQPEQPDQEVQQSAEYDPSNDPIDETKIIALKEMMKRKGVKEAAILNRYHVTDLEKLTILDWMKAMKGLEKSQDKPEEEPAQQEPENEDLGL